MDAWGRMFMVGFAGDDPPADHWIFQAIRRDHLGGVLLFDRDMDGHVRNIRNPDQVRRLIDRLRAAGDGRLLVGVDQEGGQVCRLKAAAGFASFPETAAVLGQSGVERTREVGLRMGRELASLGINWNLAPVVDIDRYPANPIIGSLGRSFGPRAVSVGAHAAAFIQGLHGSGVAGCLKHFPGHGSSRGDTHLGLVDVTASWHEEELEPYVDLIRRGLADAIMIGHLVHRRLDPTGLPATFSRPMLDLLRVQLGFSGVIVTDDLQMGAICGRWSLEEAIRQAVLAGNDLLIIGNMLGYRRNPVQVGITVIRDMLARHQVSADDLRGRLRRIERLIVSRHRHPAFARSRQVSIGSL